MPKVSIIIACYNEEAILEKNIREIKELMDLTRFDYELILIDDESKDRTVEIAKEIVSKNKNMRLICHKKNIGRGGTVAEGIRAANGDIAGFIDIDLETSSWYIIPLVKAVLDGADIAAADRIYKVKLGELSVLHRWIAHKAYKIVVRLALKTALNDTETGCKFFNRKRILSILDEIKDRHWFWDTEIMVRSLYRGLKIKEIPALFIRKKEVSSSLRFFKDTKDYIKNIIWFRKELKRNRTI